MPEMNVSIDGGWSDIPALMKADKLVNLTGNSAPYIQVTSIASGMVSGSASVILRLDLPDGKVLLVETSLALFTAAADAMRAAHERMGGMGDAN
jgi:hypothetical protein